MSTLVQRRYGFLCTYPEVLIAIGLVLVPHGNENPYSMFGFAIFIFRVLKCEAVIFYKYCLAGMHGMSISNFWHAMFI